MPWLKAQLSVCCGQLFCGVAFLSFQINIVVVLLFGTKSNLSHTMTAVTHGSSIYSRLLGNDVLVEVWVEFAEEYGVYR